MSKDIDPLAHANAGRGTALIERVDEFSDRTNGSPWAPGNPPAHRPAPVPPASSPRDPAARPSPSVAKSAAACAPDNGHDATPTRTPARGEASAPLADHDAELVRLARFTALGDMLDDLVHELNQPLAAIVNYARGCALRVAAGTLAKAELEAVLGHIADHAHGAAGQLRRTSGLARDGSGERSSIDLNEIVRDVAAFGRTHARHGGCTIHLALADRLARVNADRIKIAQSVLYIMRSCIALATRSRQTEVWLGTSRRNAAIVEVVAATYPPEAAATMVRDSGESADAALPLALQLELARARAIAREHAGHLETSIAPGLGAWFRLALTPAEEIAP